ncbi:HAD family hydrolase [Cerasicoccus maritimus]|uniref:HAD family hydrolase n=1 Tax=Cerasicoccus maritimus TaxID=490089 RepID=UPI0028527BD9|nr:HAD family hydrolase [Cerasicoccus maritimus]
MIINLNSEIKAVCFDLDGTLVEECYPNAQIDRRYLAGNFILNLLSNMIQANGYERAEELLLEYLDINIYWDYSDIIKHFKLDEKLALLWLRLWHKKNLIVMQRNVDLAYELHQAGYGIYVISNNPHLGCLLKMERAGLAGETGKGIVEGVFGSNFGLGQKMQRSFWTRVLDDIPCAPHRLAMVGDNPLEDAEVPMSVGVGQCFLVKADGCLTEVGQPV